MAMRAIGATQVLLVIDRLAVLDGLRGSQPDPGVRVLPWNIAQAQWESSGVPAHEQAELVIEAFACDPPRAYLQGCLPATRWITLDYLATEPWADDVQGRPSPHPRLAHPMAVTRQWWMPGFSTSTAGLVHGAWRHIRLSERRAWRSRLAGHALADNVFLVLAFGYPDADWTALEACLQSYLPQGFTSFKLWKPQGIEYPQSDFDEILQACDLNFVRGEDSFVRAHWAAAGFWTVPFVWQPYRQEGHAHGHKLAGWIHQILDAPGCHALADLHWAWNDIRPVGSSDTLKLEPVWHEFCKQYTAVRQALQPACERLAEQPSLEARLMSLIG